MRRFYHAAALPVPALWCSCISKGDIHWDITISGKDAASAFALSAT